MPRQTAKYSKAVEKGIELGFTVQHRNDRERLYESLLKAGYNWDGKSKTWDKNNRWLGSAFEDAHGKPTGHFKMRVMAHPREILEVIEIIQEALQEHSVSVEVTSDKTYPNRTGIGVRVYIEGTIS